MIYVGVNFLTPNEPFTEELKNSVLCIFLHFLKIFSFKGVIFAPSPARKVKG